jgi:hypothetical protein
MGIKGSPKSNEVHITPIRKIIIYHLSRIMITGVFHLDVRSRDGHCIEYSSAGVLNLFEIYRHIHSCLLTRGPQGYKPVQFTETPLQFLKMLLKYV